MTLNPIEKFKQTCRRYLILKEGHEYIDVVFGAVFANRLDSTPLWMYLIGPASSGKTEILRAMRGHSSIVCRSTITPAALISTKDPKDKKSKKNPLLVELNNKMLIIKDFTAMLTMRYEDLHTVLGYMRDAHDGEIDKEFAWETTSHEVKFGCIAAVTNAIDRHLAVLSDLGERFLCYRMPRISESEERERCLRATDVDSTDEMKIALRDAAHVLLDTEPPAPSVTKSQRRQINEAGIVTAKARTQVRRDRYTKDPEETEREVATRISKQLTDLARGIAMARAKARVTADEVALVKRVAIYTLPLRRIRLLNMLCCKEWMDVTELSAKLHLSDKGARLQLDDLELVGLCERDHGVRDAEGEKSLWRLPQRGMIRKMLRGVEISE